MIKIQVTQEDINAGVPKSPCYCPIARAVDRALDTNSSEVTRSLVSTLIKDPEKGPDKLKFTWTELPYIAVKFICDFDRDLRVQPFEFELDFK